MGKTATKRTTKTAKSPAGSKRTSGATAKTAPKPKAATPRSAAPKKNAVKENAAKENASKETARKAPKTRAPKAPVPNEPRAEIRAAVVRAAQYALEKKATDIRVLDLTGITSMTDYFVIASGDSDRQVKAIAEAVIAGMRDNEGVSPWRSEGWDSLKWILIDFVDFVVHVFQGEARTFYNLERLWGDAPSFDVKDEPVEKTTVKKKATTKAASAKKAKPSISSIEKSNEKAIRVLSDFNPVGNNPVGNNPGGSHN